MVETRRVRFKERKNAVTVQNYVSVQSFPLKTLEIISER